MSARILVVDDSATVRHWIMKQLQGYDVRLAFDGQDGIARAIEIEPDLILMDVVMPHMDGLAACRALRRNPVTASLPIIMVTSQDEEWDVAEGYVSGCTDYIAKPVDPEELLVKVATWLAATARTPDLPA